MLNYISLKRGEIAVLKSNAKFSKTTGQTGETAKFGAGEKT